MYIIIIYNMEKSIILQLSQPESNDVEKNGNYNTIITKQVDLEEGDILTVKNAFLDSTSDQQGKVNIDKDIDLHFSIIKYNINFDTTDKTYFNNDAEFKPDGLPYVACNFFSTGPDPGGGTSDLYEYIEEIVWEPDNPAYQFWGGTNWTIAYLDMQTGTHHTKTFNIPLSEPADGPYRVKDLKIAIRKNSFSNITPNGTKNVKFSSIFFGAVPAQRNIADPLITKKIVPIDKGLYDPVEIALEISKALTNNASDTEFTNLVDNPFLATTNSLGNDYLLLRGDCAEAYTFSANNYYVGASQIELLYNESDTRFYWNYIHFPYYDAAGTTISTGYKADGSGTNFVVSAHGGAFFSDLSAFERGSTTVGYNFWDEKLGFDIPTLCPTVNHIENVTVGALVLESAPSVTLTLGESITSGFTGIDTAVKKGVTVYQEPTIPFDSAINLTNPIYAVRSVDELNLSTSHFILEVQGNFQNDFRTNDKIVRTVSSIISRYYGYENYTSAEQASIQYVHKGEPVFIKSLRVRVLNPDLSDAVLGEENHVYIEIIKQK